MATEKSSGEGKPEDAGRKTSVEINSSIQAGQVEDQATIIGTRMGDVYGPVTVIQYGEQGPAAPPEPDLSAPELVHEKFEPETIFIPAGAFRMGREPGPGVPPYEAPQSEVTLTAFRIGKYPVTNQQFLKYIRETQQPVAPEYGWKGQSPSGMEEQPVRGVTWFEALDYCRWLSQATGRPYSLPSEAQWEKAARWNPGRLYPWGDEWQPERCNLGQSDFAEVSAYPPQNEAGLCDLTGNILQWTTTLWGEKRLAPDSQFRYPWQDDGRDDLQANKQIRRILRGAAFSDPPEACTCTARRSFLPTDRGQPGKWHGFRVVMLIEGRR